MPALNGEFRGQFKVSADIRHVMNDIMGTKKDLSLYTYGAWTNIVLLLCQHTAIDPFELLILAIQSGLSMIRNTIFLEEN